MNLTTSSGKSPTASTIDSLYIRVKDPWVPSARDVLIAVKWLTPDLCTKNPRAAIARSLTGHFMVDTLYSYYQ